MGMQLQFWGDRSAAIMALGLQVISRSRRQVLLLVQVSAASRGYSQVMDRRALKLKICHEEEQNKFFPGNLFSKMFLPVLTLSRSGSAVLDVRAFSDCSQGQFQPLGTAADLPLGCLGMYLSQELRKGELCNFPCLLLGFTRHDSIVAVWP